MIQDKMTRRSFLTKSAKGAAAVTLATMGSAVIGPVLGANDKLVVGVIGVGGRGQDHVRHLLRLGENVAAVADVADFRAEQAKKITGGKAETYKDYRKLLERKDVNAVVIASPDHWHHRQFIDSVEAGKDVYQEKPLSHTIREGKEMVEAVKRTGRIVQVGNQYRSDPHWARVKDEVEAGTFGKMRWIRVCDCRNWSKGDPFAPPPDFKPEGIDWEQFLGKAPKVPFDPYRYFAWRWFWDYAGGIMTDLGAHQLGLVHWIMNVKWPKSAVANGAAYQIPHWETPDVVHAVLDYGEFSVVFTPQMLNGYDGDSGVWYGTDATMTTKGKHNIYPEFGDSSTPIKSWENQGGDHMKNWLDCVRSRKQPNSTIEYGHQVITACHMANISYRTGKKVTFEDVKDEAV
ncbi:MAG: Gfo/Idh/MocA family oxidoreductase [bacterium]|nr:Gfo/Idh/MocA family oxidoreductase [bacterium]